MTCSQLHIVISTVVILNVMRGLSCRWRLLFSKSSLQVGYGCVQLLYFRVICRLFLYLRQPELDLRVAEPTLERGDVIVG